MTARRDDHIANRHIANRHIANRQCARFGCSAVAVATFTFDSLTRTVWLDTPAAGAARAGELCHRHAGSLTPPRGWRLHDRRGAAAIDELLDARTPLLARAFRSSGTV